MERKQSHINFRLNQQGESVMMIDDYELFDYISDYLCEKCDLEFECSIGVDNDAHEMNFKKNYSIEELKKYIQKLDKDEIERIYNLNN